MMIGYDIYDRFTMEHCVKATAFVIYSHSWCKSDSQLNIFFYKTHVLICCLVLHYHFWKKKKKSVREGLINNRGMIIRGAYVGIFL
jgi:hypothetical protein